MSLFGDQRQSANLAIMRLGRVACFSDVYYPILRHIIANKGDSIYRGPVLGKKKIVKNVIFSILKRVNSF